MSVGQMKCRVNRKVWYKGIDHVLQLPSVIVDIIDDIHHRSFIPSIIEIYSCMDHPLPPLPPH